MPYTLGDIADKVRLRIRDSNYDPSEIKNYINDTQNDVFNEYVLPFMEATQTYTLSPSVADITNGVGLPDNFVQALDLSLTSLGVEKVLIPRDVRYIDEFYPDSSDLTVYPPNVPNEWYMYGNTINVFHAPNSAYTVSLRYYKKPTTLVSDSDVPEIPSQFEELLVVGAAYRILQIKDSYDQAGVLENKYGELLDKLVMKYSQTQIGTPTRMRINRYSSGPLNF